MYGRPGVEFRAVLKNKVPISSLFFIQGVHQLISVSADNTVATWEMSTDHQPTLSVIKEFNIDPDG